MYANCLINETFVGKLSEQDSSEIDVAIDHYEAVHSRARHHSPPRAIEGTEASFSVEFFAPAKK